MATFITLTGAGTQATIRFSSSFITTYRPVTDDEAIRWPLARSIVNLPDEAIYVTETPEQIDAMLGVTADPVRDAAPDLLAALEAAFGEMERMGDILNGMDAVMPEDVKRATPVFDQVRAAIRAARGE